MPIDLPPAQIAKSKDISTALEKDVYNDLVAKGKPSTLVKIGESYSSTEFFIIDSKALKRARNYLGMLGIATKVVYAQKSQDAFQGQDIYLYATK